MTIQAAELRADVVVTGATQGAAQLETVDQSLKKVAATSAETAGTTKPLANGLEGVVGQVKAVAGAFVAFEGAKLLKEVVLGAEDLNQKIKTTRTLFDGAAAEVVDWSEQTASSLGLSQDASLGMVDALGQMLIGFGDTSAAAKDMSEHLVQAAVDEGAFKQQDPTEVLAAFQKGLGGAAKGLKQYGIDTSTAAQKSEALALGIDGTASSWTAAQKAAVFYQLILKGTADATGTFSARSDDLAEKQRRLSAEWSDMKDRLGQGLLPVVTDVFGAISSGFDHVGPQAQSTIVEVAGVVGVFATAAVGVATAAKAFGSLKEEMTVVNAETGALELTTAGMVVGYGAIAAAALALGIVLKQTFIPSTKSSLDLAASTDEFAKSLVGANLTASAAALSVDQLTESTEKWFKGQGAADEQTGGAIIRNLGLDYRDVTDAVSDSTSHIDLYVKSLHLSSGTTQRFTSDLYQLRDSLQASAKSTLDLLVSSNKLNPTMEQVAIKMSTAADGSVNYIAALKLVATQQVLVATNSGNLALKLELQRQAWTNLTSAIIANTDNLRGSQEGMLGILSASVSAEQGVTTVAAAQASYNKTLGEKGTKAAADQQAALLNLKQAQISQGQTVLGAVDSTEKWADTQSGLSVALKAQADALKKSGPDSDAYAHATDKVSTAQDKFRDALKAAAGTVGGPVHDALLTYIADVANLHHTVSAVPDAKTVTITTPGLSTATVRVHDYRGEMDKIPRSRHTTITVEDAAALHELALLDAAVLKINPNISLVAVNRAEAGGRGGAASGGYRGPGLTFPVGEVGQETATTLPAGGVYITSHNKTSTSIPPPSAPTSSAPTRSTTIHIDTINARDDRDVARQIRKVQRDAELLAAV